MVYILNKGVSLIELMITLVLASIILCISIPAFDTYITNERIRNVAEEMQSGLQMAKFEAIHRNMHVTFGLNQTQWQITVLGSIPSQNQVIRTRAASTSEANIVIAPQNTLTFNTQGRLTNSLATSYVISNPTEGNCRSNGGPVQCLQVNVSLAGLIKMCDPSLPNTDARGC